MKVAKVQYPHADRTERYTPVSPQLLEALERWKVEYGSWRTLAEGMRCSTRQLRYIRKKFKTVGFTVLERLLLNIGKEYYLDGLPWYTVDELLSMGIWKEMIDVGHEFPGGKAKDDMEGRFPY